MSQGTLDFGSDYEAYTDRLPTLRVELGKSLRAHRILAGMTQEKAAERLKCNLHDLAKMEGGSERRSVTPDKARRFGEFVAVDRIAFEFAYHEYIFGRVASGLCDNPDDSEVEGLFLGFQRDYDSGWSKGGEGVNEAYKDECFFRLQALAIDLLRKPSRNAVRATHTLAHWHMVSGRHEVAYRIAKESRTAAKEVSEVEEGWSMLRTAMAHRLFEGVSLQASLREFKKVWDFLIEKDIPNSPAEPCVLLAHMFHRERLATMLNSELMQGNIHSTNKKLCAIAHTDLAEIERSKKPRTLTRKHRTTHVAAEARVVFGIGSVTDRDAAFIISAAKGFDSRFADVSYNRAMAIVWTHLGAHDRAKECVDAGIQICTDFKFLSALKLLKPLPLAIQNSIR